MLSNVEPSRRLGTISSSGDSYNVTRVENSANVNAIVLPKYPSDGLPISAARG